MFRRRRGYRSSRRVKKVRYSNETTAFGATDTIAVDTVKTLPEYDAGGGKTILGAMLVSPTDLQGTRKVKNISLSITSQNNVVPLLCAVVYVPSGTQPSKMGIYGGTSSGTSLYEPNQNVIMQFVLNPVKDTNVGSEVQNFKTRLARNLDSGDSIRFIYTPAVSHSAAQDVKIYGTCNYAISY